MVRLVLSIQAAWWDKPINFKLIDRSVQPAKPIVHDHIIWHMKSLLPCIDGIIGSMLHFRKFRGAAAFSKRDCSTV